MTEQITVQVTTAGGRAVVAAFGEIDMASAPTLKAAIEQVIQNGTRQLIVDLEGVRFLDSSALNLLVAVRKRLGPGCLGVVASQRNVRRIFALTGIDTLIPMFYTVDAAIEAASESASD